MNKKLNSVIYILVATVVNLLLLMTFMALAMGVFALLVHLVPSIAESSMAMVIMMLLIVEFVAFGFNKSINSQSIRKSLRRGSK